ncbi:sodium-dependent proline transporter-like [Dermacentor variabilis]|uniref:sodium-dependent proline transporter-like n=1 Tax=Dermacentor variabilis TaxID=34621 RepID=UPI003F5B3343
MDERKEKWSSSLEFVCSCIGYSVGLGNLWRFPYVAYKYGGSAFVLPYVVVNLLIGRPIYYFELLMGQFCGRGPLGVFRMSPMLQGNAFGMMWAAFVMTLYYQMIIAYTVLYFYHSFKTPLPWTDCFDWWGVALDGCFARRRTARVCASVRKSVVLAGLNDTDAESPVVVTYAGSSVLLSQGEYESRFAGCVDADASSVDVFYNRMVLNASSSFEQVGSVQPNLAISYAICWTIVFLVIFKGIKVVGKVVVITAVAPYVILTVLLVRGVTLPGASLGLRYLLAPQWDSLLSPDVWRAATEQTFYSLSIGTGGLLVYGSYQPFSTATVSSSATFVCVADLLTSAFASIVVFSVLGNMAHALDVPVADVVAAGPGLAFVTYPEALSLIPFPNLWSALFFAMLFFLGISSEIGCCEFLTDSIRELFPSLARQRALTAFMYCSGCFLVGLVLCTQVGLYVITLLDNYLGGLIMLVTCLAETIIFAWIYGMNRICLDVTFMTGTCPSYFVLIAFKYCAPVVLGSFLAYSLYVFPRSTVGDYLLPLWADVFGWVLAVVGLAPLFIVAAVKLVQCGFSWHRAADPDSDWGPEEYKHRLPYRERLYEAGFAEPLRFLAASPPAVLAATAKTTPRASPSVAARTMTTSAGTAQLDHWRRPLQSSTEDGDRKMASPSSKRWL